MVLCFLKSISVDRECRMVLDVIIIIYVTLHFKKSTGKEAFDSVNQDILLSKLPYYGIRGKAKLLLESYLQNRYQRVQITDSYSNTRSVRMDQNNMRSASGVNFGPITIPSIH